MALGLPYSHKKEFFGTQYLDALRPFFRFFPQKWPFFLPFSCHFHHRMIPGHPNSVWQPLSVSYQPLLGPQAKKIEELALHVLSRLDYIAHYNMQVLPGLNLQFFSAWGPKSGWFGTDKGYQTLLRWQGIILRWK